MCIKVLELGSAVLKRDMRLYPATFSAAESEGLQQHSVLQRGSAVSRKMQTGCAKEVHI